MTGLTGRRVAVLLAVTPAAVGAQEAPTTNTALPSPLPAPTAAPTPQPEPAPVVTPPPVVVPTPAATPSTAATPVAPPATREPVAKPTPAATPAPDVRVPATSNPDEPLPPAAAPTPIPTPAPPTSAPVAPPTERVEEGSGAWPWLALLLLGFVVVAAYRRVRRRSPEPVAEPEPQPAPAPAATAPPPEPRVTIAFRPTRAGLNMLSATVEGELIVANTGSEPVREVRVATRLLSAHAGQDADLAAFAAASVNRPAVPPFALAAGERRAVRIVAATPREELRVMTAAGRPMFVPVLAVAVDAAGERAAQAFAIGVERVDSAKLAPFWLDVPARSYDQVAARAHRAMSGGPSDDR